MKRERDKVCQTGTHLVCPRLTHFVKKMLCILCEICYTVTMNIPHGGSAYEA